MIKSLQVRNYAIIEEVEINFSKGLTIITGETGAGKSILLGALNLIMGGRADLKSLYQEDKKCVIEACFDVSKYGLKAFFETHDVDFEEECVVRREITPSGKSRAFVNDTPVNLKFLNELSGSLIDLHQQFDTLDIHKVSFQLRLVDALANNKDRLEVYKKLYTSYNQNKRALVKLLDETAQANKEMDFLTYQLNELNEASLESGEQEGLEQELSSLTNAEDIKRVLSAAHHALSESEQPLLGQIQDLANTIGSLQDFNPAIKSLYQKLNSMVLELEDMSGELENIADSTEYDPARIAEAQGKLDIIYRLQKKHQVLDIDALLAIQEELNTKLTKYGDLSADIEQLEATIAEQEEKLQKKAATLSKTRRAVVASFEKKIHEMLAELTMPNARLKVDIQTSETLTSTGIDEVNFLFAANKGGKLQLIKDVASGGELSRLTLVTKSLVASAIPLPTMIFDEIDSGVSGDVALRMGNILRKLSNEHQVVSITHSPQIASKADAHYFIYKTDTEERTITRVRQLNKEERIRSIATMLSTNPPSASALANAKELVEMAEV